jgi:hypothetical protein
MAKCGSFSSNPEFAHHPVHPVDIEKAKIEAP